MNSEILCGVLNTQYTTSTKKEVFNLLIPTINYTLSVQEILNILSLFRHRDDKIDIIDKLLELKKLTFNKELINKLFENDIKFDNMKT